MVRFPSSFSPEELTERWDDFTSPARFAGNDDTMDLIFIAKRKGDKVRLVRRARTAREPFCGVFRGRIKKTKEGSEITGFFTKSFGDYFIVASALALLFYIRTLVIERGGNIFSVNALLTVAIIGSLLLLMNYRPTKRRYADFICRITGNDIPLFLSKREERSRETEDQTE